MLTDIIGDGRLHLAADKTPLLYHVWYLSAAIIAFTSYVVNGFLSDELNKKHILSYKINHRVRDAPTPVLLWEHTASIIFRQKNAARRVAGSVKAWSSRRLLYPKVRDSSPAQHV